MARTQRVVIGWREWLALPALGVPAIKAKIDTGARTSALHAFDVEIFRDRGQKMARFNVHPLQRHDEIVITAEAPLVEHRTVRSSSGDQSHRPVICTDIELMGRRWTTEITLVNRDAMGFRMLLGRLALRRGFVVRPGCSYRGGKPPRELVRPRTYGETITGGELR